MKSVDSEELERGMVLGADIVYEGELLYPKDTVLNSTIVKRLKMYAIKNITVMEDIELAATHFERLRFKEDFKVFMEKHAQNLILYKELIEGFVANGWQIPKKRLLDIYNDMASTYSYGSELLDFLYNLVINEDELIYVQCLNAALLAGKFADWSNMSEEDTEQLILACFYYDIGKLKLPEELLKKTGKLTDEEFALIRKHPVLGYALVNPAPLDQRIKNAVIMHHERMDGTGYPYHMKGKTIELYARYIAIIDTYIAMASPRAYREALTPMQILAFFEENLHPYDVELLLPLMTCIANAQIGTTIQLSDGTVWDIFAINPIKVSRPILKNDHADVLDLMEHPNLEIVKNI